MADVFALLPDGTESHATALPGGTYQLDGLSAKSRLFVETEFLGVARNEILLQAVPRSLVDVVFVARTRPSS